MFVPRIFWLLYFWLLYFALLCLVGCAAQEPPAPASVRGGHKGARADAYESARRQMVERQLRARGIKDASVLDALRRVPRHRFVPEALAHRAYQDGPLPIGHGQTISQPYIVAYMSEAAGVSKKSKVLEIGTGSGYQAAVLGELARQVYSIEIGPQLAARARRTLGDLGYGNVHVRAGNGYLGWPEHAPFDAIVVTAAPEEVPPALVAQLAVGGKLVVPVGAAEQDMLIITKTKGGVLTKKTLPVRFVPMTAKPAPK